MHRAKLDLQSALGTELSITITSEEGSGKYRNTTEGIMNITNRWIWFILLLFPVYSPLLFAQPVAQETRRTWWDDIPGFLNQQHTYSLEAAVALLEKYPPSLDPTLERRAAFCLLDNVFHDPEAPTYPAIQQHFIQSTQRVLAALKSTTITEGAHIWKLYNHGFVVRTASATIAFDVVSGKHIGNEGFHLSKDDIETFAEQCDALFISHLHCDHADQTVAQSFISKGKPVVVPENLWQKETFTDKLTCLERSADKVHTLLIQDGKASLDVVVYPGHQGPVLLNNVTLVRMPENITIVQTGDQSNPADFKWIDSIKDHHTIDILLPNCWTTEMPRVIAGADPAIVITGHENELGHSIDHREPYWLNTARLGEGISRYITMTWGESFAYRKAAK